MYIIKDWFGNTKDWGEFDSFEKADAALYTKVRTTLVKGSVEPEFETFVELIVRNLYSKYRVEEE